MWHTLINRADCLSASSWSVGAKLPAVKVQGRQVLRREQAGKGDRIDRHDRPVLADFANDSQQPCSHYTACKADEGFMFSPCAETLRTYEERADREREAARDSV